MASIENSAQDKAKATLVASLDNMIALKATYKRQRFALHSHPTFVFALITAGALRFRCENKVLVAPSGSVCIINPDQVQTGEGVGSEGWSYWSAYVPASVFETEPGEGNAEAGRPFFDRNVFTDGTAARLLSTFFSAIDASQPSLAQAELLLNCLSSIASLHGAERRPQRRDVSPRLVRSAMEFMAQNFASAILLDDIARTLGVTGFHLTRTFKENTGLAMHAWLVQYRVQRARAMLLGGAPLADTAAASGFSDQPHMTRWFRRLLGMTPGEVQAMSRTFNTSSAFGAN